jgi:hypothetical protein
MAESEFEFKIRRAKERKNTEDALNVILNDFKDKFCKSGETLRLELKNGQVELTITCALNSTHVIIDRLPSNVIDHRFPNLGPQSRG